MKPPKAVPMSPRLVTRLAALVVPLWLASSGLQAQGCAMCKTALAGQAERVIASLGLGVAILLLPPLVIVSAILYTAFRRGG